ncbi:MAG TPA: flagellar hook-associated protein FlgK [Marmoricola sp.]|jgi:flagellar hook-associated protein 1 FlgK|nr:flagellar hook-associated protein FlgK [Marmoricola sp.]
MTSTFSTLSTALSALQYNSAALAVAGGNIANVSTAGYARRTINAESVAQSGMPAMWSRSVSNGDGVKVGSVQRMVDPLLDAQARRQHASQAYLDVQQSSLQRVETGFNEPGASGVAAAIADFRTSWHDLANNPGSDAARSEVLGKAATLASAIGTQAANITTESGDQRTRILNDVSEVNSVATELASTNKAINAASLNGSDTGTLLDTRDQLALRLSELTGATATTRADGEFDVTLNGVSLVDGASAGTLQIASGITSTGASDGNVISYAITDSSRTTAVPAGMTGEIGGVTDLLTTTLPAYSSGLDAVAQQLADEINTQHEAGYDANGNAGTAFFSYDPTDPAATLAVAITSTSALAASGIPGGGLDAANATAMAGSTTVEASYQQLINGFGTHVDAVNRATTSQQTLTTQVDTSRTALSGVSTDEELTSMLTSQRSYQAASRVMTTVDSMLDTLINHTGLVA